MNDDPPQSFMCDDHEYVGAEECPQCARIWDYAWLTSTPGAVPPED